MKIALAQIDCDIERPEANLRKVHTLCEHAAEQGCRLAVFPELTDTGYDLQAVHQSARPLDGLPYRQLSAIAIEENIYIACGLALRVGSDIFNTLAVFDPKGQRIAHYLKVHLFSTDPVREDKVFKAGNDLVTVAIDDWTMGLAICYDLRFPEWLRKLALAGAEAILLPSAWPASRVVHWKTLTEARAIENQFYMLAANRAGTDTDVVMAGATRLIDPWGTVLAEAGPKEERLVIGEIDKDIVTQTRHSMDVFKHRRPELY
jgi:predicted amidohydrolase